VWKLGNVMDDRLEDLLNSDDHVRFGLAKADLPAACLECRWLPYCRGGCPHYWKVKPFDGGCNRLCNGLRVFFEHANERLPSLSGGFDRQVDSSGHGRQAPRGRPAHKIGRNTPCSCGSGKKYKKCCGR
jgi:uncharacterized protein